MKIIISQFLLYLIVGLPHKPQTDELLDVRRTKNYAEYTVIILNE